MKIDISSLALMTAALGSTVNAWSFYVDDYLEQKMDAKMPCDEITAYENQKIDFYEGVWEDCEFILYEDKKCGNWAGSSNGEWRNLILSMDVFSYSVTCD